MTAAAEVSVIIVTFRCRDLVLDCLADLEVARGTVALEVFVVDNASGDGTADAIATTFPWVDVEALDENVGFARANNRAIHRCRAPAVLLLNPDTRIEAAAIVALLNALASEPAVGLIGPRVIDPAGRTDPNCRRGFPTVLGVAGAVTGLDRRLGGRLLGEYLRPWLPLDQPSDVVALSGSVMLARSSALTAVEGFDDCFFMYGEDIDLCLRVADAGWRVRYTPSATVVHVGGGFPGSPQARRAWSRSIGDIHRRRRPGLRGEIAGMVCDLGGTVLALFPGLFTRKPPHEKGSSVTARLGRL